MKFSFKTDMVPDLTFEEVCNTARDYGFSGFEICGIDVSAAVGGLFDPYSAAGARRKLVNRHISVPVLYCPEAVGEAADTKLIKKYIETAGYSAIPFVRVTISDKAGLPDIKQLLDPVMPLTEELGVTLLFSTTGSYSDTSKVIELINMFGCGSVGASWDIAETFFTARETAEKTIQTLGAYICNVHIGDRSDGRSVLTGDGELPVDEFLFALRSLNYEGFICVDENDEIKNTDIVFTHFVNFMNRKTSGDNGLQSLYYNRSHTGRYVWKRYDVIDKTFSEVLDTMVEHFPDQYAFKYTTLDYTRTYSEFRRDVDKVAAALISLGVKPGYHVAIWATNIPQWFLTFWATVKIGAVLVTVNTAYKLHEAEYLLRQSDTHTLVMIDSCKDSNYKEIMETLCPELRDLAPGKPLHSAKLPFLKNIVTVGFKMDGCLDWDGMMSRADSVPAA